MNFKFKMFIYKEVFQEIVIEAPSRQAAEQAYTEGSYVPQVERVVEHERSIYKLPENAK